MKKFTICLSSVIFIVLVTGSVQSVIADESGNNNAVSEDGDKLNIIPTENTKYKIYLHVIVRDAQEQLVSVSETMDGGYFAHEITDYAFDHDLPLVRGVVIKPDTTLIPPTDKKEIIIIDNMKYEKIQYSDTFTFNSKQSQKSKWALNVCGESMKKYGGECARIFGASTITIMYPEINDVITTNWTILREMN